MQRLQTIADGISRVGRGRRRRAAAGRRDRDLHRHHVALHACPGRSAARMSSPAMRSRSPAPGASRRRCSRARTSASTPLYVRVRQRVRAALDLLSLAALIFLLLAGDVARLGRAAAILDLRLALAVRDPDAARSFRRRFGCWASPSSSRSASCCSRAGCAPSSPATCERLFALIGSKSAVAEAEEEIIAVEKAFAQEREQERKP